MTDAASAASTPTPPPARPAPLLTTALVLAMLLAATAGFVDAHIFLHVTQAFVANQSGNLIHLGMFTGRGDGLEAFRSLLAIGSFVVGVAVATRVQRRDKERAGSPSRPEVLLAGEAVLLLVLTAFLFTIDPEPLRRPGGGELLAVAIGAVAMGIQAAALTRAGTVAVTTTYETGSLVRIGQNVLLSAESRTVAVLALVVSSYVGGAAASAAAGGATALMLIPVGAIALAAVLVRRPA